MKALFFLLICLLTVRICAAQECRLTGLSPKYDYLITTAKAKDENNNFQISKIYVDVISKLNKKSLQKLFIKPNRLFEDAYANCSAVRSYTTGLNSEAEADDNDFGDFIVADLNFDGREDFAIKQDSGGNGGAFYEFYFQNKFGKFEKDSFLTKEMGYFPSTIDARNKRLITYVHANVAGYNENIYKYNPKTKSWRLLKSTYIKAG